MLDPGNYPDKDQSGLFTKEQFFNPDDVFVTSIFSINYHFPDASRVFKFSYYYIKVMFCCRISVVGEKYYARVGQCGLLHGSRI